MEFYQAGRTEGGSFDDGIEAALQRMLADPEFVYRGEPEPAGLAAGKSYRISDLALASRLSFFLWSSIPDDELIDLAAQGKLKDPAVLEKQVRRMLADPKSEALITNFTGQWLSVRSLKTSEPVVNLFPDFDDNLRAAFQREIELFFGSIVHEDRSILDLLTADYTFVNERLAKHYGIPNIYGPQFRRVTLPAGSRHAPRPAGQGRAVDGDVERGAHLAGHARQVVPANVPRRQPAGSAAERPGHQGQAGGHHRQREESRPCARPWKLHHTNPVCASCHKIFEPIGLALENFDAVGSWRTQDGDSPIDATGVLVDGTKVDGVASLRDVLVRRSDQFVRVVTEKLLTYALGRGVEYQDMPLVRSIVRDSAGSNYKFSSLVLGIVKSPAFQMNMKAAASGQDQRRSSLDEETPSCSSPKSTFPAGRFCAAPARRSRCRLLDAMIPAVDGAGADGGHPEASLRRLLRAARHGARLLGPRARKAHWTPRFPSTGSRWNRSRTRP